MENMIQNSPNDDKEILRQKEGNKSIEIIEEVQKDLSNTLKDFKTERIKQTQALTDMKELIRNLGPIRANRSINPIKDKLPNDDRINLNKE